MSETSTSSSTLGAGFWGWLTLIFVVAKLWHVVDWPWFTVFLPLIAPFAFVGLLIVAALGVAAIVAAVFLVILLLAAAYDLIVWAINHFKR